MEQAFLPEDLYQDVLLDHHQHPRNFRKLPVFDSCSEGKNPLCGDTIKLYLKVNNGIIEDIGFEGTGCVISKASASLMTEAVKGKSTVEAQKIFEQFHQFLMKPQEDETVADQLGDLSAFSGVRAFPVRVKCASLAWHALKAALQGEGKQISTE